MTNLPLVALLWLIPGLPMQGQQRGQVKQLEGVGRTFRNNDAVILALADVLTIPEPHRRFMWYIWREDVPPPRLKSEVRLAKGQRDLRSLRTISLAANAASQGAFIFRPIILADGHLLRLDIRVFDPELRSWPKVRDEFGFDPQFSLLITRDLAEFSSDAFFDSLRLTFIEAKGKEWTEERTIDHPGGVFKYPDGSFGLDPSGNEIVEKELEAGRYTAELHFRQKAGQVSVSRRWCRQRFAADKNIDVLRFNSPDIDPVAFAQLQAEVGTIAPVVSDRCFKWRILSTLKDFKAGEDGIFKAVFGGQHYEAKGVRTSKDQKEATDLDLFLEDLGIGSKGNRIKQFHCDLLWEAITESDVTGKGRAIFAANAATARLVNAKGYGTVDVRDKDIDLNQQLFANLRDPFSVAQAFELIFPDRNGLPRIGLFNGQGVLQEETPSGQGGVVDNHKVPQPRTHRLFGWLACASCHGADHDYFQPVNREKSVRKILAGELNPNLLLFPISVGASKADPRLKLIEQYGADLNGQLAQGRLDFQRTVRECVELGPGSVWEGSDAKNHPGWEDVGRLASEHLTQESWQWFYDPVSAEEALRDLGIVLDEKDSETPEARKDRAAAVFNAVVPQTIPSLVTGIPTEDPRILALRRSVLISRQSWSLVRSIASRGVNRKAIPLKKAG